jgi:hypothetical protein
MIYDFFVPFSCGGINKPPLHFPKSHHSIREQRELILTLALLVIRCKKFFAGRSNRYTFNNMLTSFFLSRQAISGVTEH